MEPVRSSPRASGPGTGRRTRTLAATSARPRSSANGQNRLNGGNVTSDAGRRETAPELLSHERLDAFTHARLWRNPCGFAARFNYLSMRYNRPLYGWVQERFGLARFEFAVIYSLALHDGITASEIATSTAFPKNTLSRAVNRLAKLRLIVRRVDAIDRRQQFLSLSPTGRAVFDEALPRFVALEEAMLAPLNLIERETLATLTAKVVLAMFRADAPTAPDNGPALSWAALED